MSRDDGRRSSDVQNNSEGLRTESATPVALKVGDWVEVISVARVTELDGKGLAHTVIETDSDGWVSASAVTRVDLDDPRLDAISGPNEPTCAECGKGPTVAHYCTICNDVIGKLVDADERRRSEAAQSVIVVPVIPINEDDQRIVGDLVRKATEGHRTRRLVPADAQPDLSPNFFRTMAKMAVFIAHGDQVSTALEDGEEAMGEYLREQWMAGPRPAEAIPVREWERLRCAVAMLLEPLADFGKRTYKADDRTIVDLTEAFMATSPRRERGSPVPLDPAKVCSHGYTNCTDAHDDIDVCPDCDQPMLPAGEVKRPGEYDHASGCPRSTRSSGSAHPVRFMFQGSERCLSFNEAHELKDRIIRAIEDAAYPDTPFTRKEGGSDD